MRFVHPLRTRRVGVLAALVMLASVFLGTSALSAGSPALADGTPEGSAEVVGPDGLPVVERQISSDMVVDWLEEPPADAADLLTAPEAPADHSAPRGDSHAGHGHADGDAGGETPPTPTEPDDETVSSTEAATTAGSYEGATPGNGFAVFSTSPRWLTTGYTIRLAGGDARIEQYRDEFVAAARAASSTSGVPIRVATGRSGSVNPARGEITVILERGPCGSAAVGCGGPAMTSTDLVSGRVWIYPSALNMSSANRSNLAAHELGHALGLRHYESNWRDGRQGMYPVISGITSYRAGDRTGLKFMAGGYDRSAGSITARDYAAGQMHIAGTLSSGSRVRVTVGAKSRDVRATGGRFATEIPAGAGSHRVCVTSLDAAAGFRRELGCAQVSAPGTPIGRSEVVANSFETIRVSGWAIDPQTAAPVEVEIRRNGARVTTATADALRPDIAEAHRHYGSAHGYSLEIPAVAGANDVCVRILGVGGGGDKDLGCRSVVHAVDPVGVFEVSLSTEFGTIVSGWALDPNTPSPVNVTVAVDGAVPAVPGIFRAADDRPDVARDHPAHGPAHGFSQRLVLTPGDHEVCLTVANVGLGRDRGLGCVRVHVDAATDLGSVVDSVDSGASAAPLTDVSGTSSDVVGAVRPAVATVAGALSPSLG